MKNRLVAVINGTLILIFSCLFIWSLWPLPRDTQTLLPNQSYLDPELIQSCPPLQQLLNSQFKLGYPKKLWKSESHEVVLTIEPQQDNTSDSENQNTACSLVLDTRLDSNSLSIEPGDRIVVPYTSQMTQTILYNIMPHDVNAAEGEFWINVDAYIADGDNPVRVPLFIIPLDFSVTSVLGFPPVLMRYICLFALILQLLIAFRKRLFG